MPVKNFNSSEITWSESRNTAINLPGFDKEFVNFYNSCQFGPLKINIGDFVLITNADGYDPESLTSCNIAEIIYMYELLEGPKGRDPCRAIVKWYSRCNEIPHKLIGDEEKIFDFDKELIQDHRGFDRDISIETIFRKCSIIFGMESETANEILGQKIRTVPTYACRYKIVRIKGLKSYKIIPYNYPEDLFDNKTPTKTKLESLRLTRTPSSQNKNVYSVVKTKEKSKTPDKKITPIKIINNNTVTKSSGKSGTNGIKQVNVKLDKRNNDDVSRNVHSPGIGARRRLSLDQQNDTDLEDDVMNYSIVKATPDKNHNIKIKLRISEKQNSINSNSQKELSPINENENNKTQPLKRSTRKRSTDINNDMILREIDNNSTPKKNRRQSIDQNTPKSLIISNRRRSILKTPGTPNLGTPKKSIQLSNIIEEFGGNSQLPYDLRTPKRSTFRVLNADQDLKPVTPKSATTTRKRKDSIDDDEDYMKTPKSKKKEIETPKSTKSSASKRKLLRDGVITPQIASKEYSSNKRKSDIQLTRERLHVSAAPASLPCRESEFDNIYSFLERKIIDQSGGCMYVSGVPGTGKTATVTEVIKALKRESNLEEIPEFQYIEINGLRLTEPQQAYVQIFRQLTGKTIAWKQAYNLLQKRFMTPSPKRGPTVLLIDELDIICNRRQDVVYNLLDWSTKSAAKLAVITIANTMDLPERFLHGKVTSRLGLTRLTFLPYTFKQLQIIVTDRLSGCDSFKSEAVQLVSRKIAAVSGDARRALDICRRATEIAEDKVVPGNNVIVNLMHVQQALGEMISSGKFQAIKKCSKLEKLFLQAVSTETIRTGVEETTFLGVYTQLESLATFSGNQIPSTGHALRLCSKLGELRLLICEHSRNDLYRKILLNVSSDDIHFALQEDLI